MSVYLSDNGTRFKGIGYALRVTCAMSVNIDIRGEGVRPTLKTSRMSVYLSDTGMVGPEGHPRPVEHPTLVIMILML